MNNRFQAALDRELFKKIVRNAESHYVDGEPLHRKASARDIFATPEKDGVSCVFVCTLDEFKEMPVKTKHHIFKNRHILVLDTNTSERWDFDEASLARMGSLDDQRQLQCKCFHTVCHISSLIDIPRGSFEIGGRKHGPSQERYNPAGDRGQEEGPQRCVERIGSASGRFQLRRSSPLF